MPERSTSMILSLFSPIASNRILFPVDRTIGAHGRCSSASNETLMAQFRELAEAEGNSFTRFLERLMFRWTWLH